MRAIARKIVKRGGVGRLVFSTWLGVYPILTAVAVLLEPVMAPRPVWHQTLIMSLIMVPIMVLIVMPIFRKWM